MTESCSIDGCTKPRKYRSMCAMHYARLRRYGSLDDPRPTIVERFWAKVDRSGECWLWKASGQASGYGHFTPRKGQLVMAHRFAYELAVGAIPAGFVIDHLCRTPACVNPAHLEAVTNAENLRRGIGFPGTRSRQTHCIHGHEFTPENTKRTHRGTRSCRACDRIRAAARRAEMRADR